MEESRHWYAMHLFYIRPASAAPALEEAGIEYFSPPTVNSLIFLRAGKTQLYNFLTFTATGQRVKHMRSRIDGSEIIVKDADMDIFIRICQSFGEPVIMTEAPKVKLGDRVRVKEGSLAGLEGNVVRIRKQKRVLVCIAGIIWATTAHIPAEMLEVIPDDSGSADEKG